MVGRHTQTQSYFSSGSLSLMSCLSLGCCSIGLHNFLHNENQRTSSSDRDLFCDGATMDFLHCTQEGSRVWVEKSKLQQSLWFLAKSFFHSKNEIIRSVENFSKSYFFTQVKYAPHQFRIFFNIHSSWQWLPGPKKSSSKSTYIGTKVHIVATWGTIKKLNFSTPLGDSS